LVSSLSKPDEIALPIPLRILSNRLATPTARSLRIALDDVPFSYRAGQAALLAAEGDTELTPYSLASAPEETSKTGSIEFLVKVDGSTRFGSRVSSLHRGERVQLSGPLGSFVLPDYPASPTLLFIAGGTGIAPLRSMIRHVLETRRGAAIHVLYSARSSREFAYLPELRALARDGALDLRLTVTGKAGRWRHARGRIDAVQLAPLVAVPDTMAFICGPPAMLASVTAALLDLGVGRDRVKTETW
jgi:ferredoxin-NADP reductase